ncbi:MAG: 5'-methylthioadenosine/adenosylhomocysteine nucleosidase [Comamonadaceae bacterium]|nr:MAG: 5'-methylthioadenosine/adenosylhomocysteine nucleosidase [Comamonadaceae bacterium]
MTTAIVSAMAEEQHGMLELLGNVVTITHAGRDFHRGAYRGHDVVLVLARIGKVAAATTATALIDKFAVKRIAFTGVAGGLGANVRVGDVVVADSFMQHDMDASPIFPKYEIPLYGLSRFVADPLMTQALQAASLATVASPAGTLGSNALQEFGIAAPRVHTGLLISGDRFVSTNAESQALRDALPQALACEMEGSAVAQVCHDYGIPFAAMRTISDRADDAAHVDFPRFIEQVAGPYAAGVMKRFLDLLPPV